MAYTFKFCWFVWCLIGCAAIKPEMEPGQIHWKEVPTVGSHPSRMLAATTVYQDRFYVFGGSDSRGVSHNDVHVLDTSTWEWAAQSPQGTPPDPRKAAASFRVENKWYVFGGFDLAYWPVVYTDVHCLIWANDGVEQPQGQCDRETLGIHTKGLVNQFSDLFVLDLDTLTWSKIEMDNAPMPVYGSVLTVLDNMMYLVGGHHFNQTKLEFLGNPKILSTPIGKNGELLESSWIEVPQQETEYTPRNGLSIFTKPGFLIVQSGEAWRVDESGINFSNRVKDLWYFELATGIWTKQEKPQYPTTFYHRSVHLRSPEIDSEFTEYVFGGKCKFLFFLCVFFFVCVSYCSFYMNPLPFLYPRQWPDLQQRGKI